MRALSFLLPCLLFLCDVKGEVAENFNKCKESFFKGTPVSGLDIALPTPQDTTAGLVNYEQCLSAYNAASPAHICQTYNEQYYFATLYDRGRRIPLYSAYLVDIKGTPEREGDIVNFEPQLVHPSLPSEQMDKLTSQRAIRDYNNIQGCKEQSAQYRQTYKLAWSQALKDNFGEYDRGHLNPAGHHGQGDASKATMTHTNVAPQDPKMNQVVWNLYEKKMKEVLSAGCSKMYAVTGVVPSGEWVDQNKRVNVPSHYWSAYCCTDNNDKPVKSGGAVCPNLNIQKDTAVTEYDTVAQLESELKGLLNLTNDIHIFNGCVKPGL